MTTPAGAGADHYLAHPYATVQLWRWATVRTDVTGTTTDQGDALRTNDDLSLLVYLDTVGSPSDRFPRVVSSPLVGPAFIPGDVAYLALTCFTEVFRGNPPGQVVLRVTEVVAGQVGKPHHVAVPAGQGVLVTTTVPYEPIIADGPRSLRLELMGEDNPSLDCRVFVTRLAVTTYAPVGGGGTTRQTAGGSHPRGVLTAAGRTEPGQPQYVGPVDVRPTLVAVGLTGAPSVTAVPQGLTATQQVAAPTIVPNSAASATLQAGSALTAAGFTATSTVRAQEGLVGQLAAAGSFLASTAIGAQLRVDVALAATGFASVTSRTGSSSLRGFGSAAGSATATTSLTGQLPAGGQLVATGRTATAVATARDGLTGALAATGQQTGVLGTGALAAGSTLTATGTTQVQIREAAAAQAAAIQSAVQAVLVTVGRAVLELVTSTLQAVGVDATETQDNLGTGLVASFLAAQHDAETFVGEAQLHQEVRLGANYVRSLQLGDQPPVHLLAGLDVDPAGLPSGTAFAAAAARLVAAGVAGPATAGVVWNQLATAALAVDPAAIIVTRVGHSATCAATSSCALNTDATYLTRIPQFVTLQVDSSLQVQVQGIVIQQAGVANLLVDCRLRIPEGQVYEATQVGGAATTLVMRTGAALTASGYVTGDQGAHLQATAGSRIEATAIPLLDAGLVSTLALRATATLTCSTTQISSLIVRQGGAHLLQQISLSAVPSGAQPVTAAVQLRATAGQLVAGAMRGQEQALLAAQLHASCQLQAAARAENAVGQVTGRVFLEARTALLSPETYLWNQPAASTIAAGAQLRVDEGDPGQLVELTGQQLRVACEMLVHGQQRISAGLQARSTCRVTTYQAVSGALNEAQLHASTGWQLAQPLVLGDTVHAAAALAAEAHTEASLQDALAGLVGAVYGVAAVEAAAQLRAHPPIHYAGADLRATARLHRTFPGRPTRLRSRARLACAGSEGLLVGGGQASLTPAPQGRTQARSSTSRSVPRATVTATAGALQPGEPLNVASSVTSTSAAGQAGGTT